MTKPQAEKTKPEVLLTITVVQVAMEPGRIDESGNPDCQLTINAISSDPDQGRIIVPVNMQTYIDALPSNYVSYINDFFEKAFADAIGVTTGSIVGDFISQTP